MILVRDIFRIRFGQMKGALASLKAFSSDLTESGEEFPMRVLTDVTGPYYTLVLESTFENLAAWESMSHSEMATAKWQEWYKNFLPFLEDGKREIFTIEL
ncbi:MAG: hypothetical protein M5R41_07560 [Bacteroidia bacterium]|nr:hypothetical protein [Bacteroidia bacterium]